MLHWDLPLIEFYNLHAHAVRRWAGDTASKVGAGRGQPRVLRHRGRSDVDTPGWRYNGTRHSLGVAGPMKTLIAIVLLLAPSAYGQETKVPAPEWVNSWRALAEKGNSVTQYFLGLMYDEGKGVPQDYAEAVRWYRKAADQGNAGAQYFLGLMCNEGKGVPQDYAEAVRWYRKAADQGNATAQYVLGLLYDEGKGVLQDYAEAVRWYRKAADQGNAGAQENLGVMYAEGQGVPQDYAEAVRWWGKAADQESAGAQHNMGLAYWRGQGVPQDYAEAHMWLNLAASRASGDEQKKFAELREGMAKKMTPQQIAEAQRRAREWKPKSGGNKLAGPIK